MLAIGPGFAYNGREGGHLTNMVGNKVTETLADDLVRAGLITPTQLAVARVSQETLGEDLGRVLIEKGFVSESELLAFFAKSLSVPYISLADVEIDTSLIKKMPLHLAQRYHLIPLKKEGEKIVVAMSDPLNMFALDDIRVALRQDVNPVLSSAEEIDAMIARYYGTRKPVDMGSSSNLELMDFGSDDSLENLGSVGEKLEQIATGPKVIQAVNEMIVRAFKEKASDIHLEPTRDGIRVRYRIDGFLEERQRLFREMMLPVVSRIKILGGMDIAERRIPQDGRMQIRIGGTALDLRLSTYPTLYGEKVVMRLLSKDAVIGIESLGFNDRDRKTFADLIMRSHGIFMVTGPTGSGKSTTLYASLTRINSPDKNIISIEDPVESEIAGVNQAQINPKAGVTFASALRSILRQDPDVIMIGEIRDAETAQIAVRAAITGHLVLTTLHTNTAAGAVARLLDLGTEPFLISSSLIGVLAQRLVRKVCVACRREIEPDRSKLGPLSPLLQRSYQGQGCAACRMSGYSGRIGIFELAPIGESVRGMINERASEHVVEQELRRLGVRSILGDGLDKANEGITTIDEVLRVTQEE